jgi:hypothetical protein
MANAFKNIATLVAGTSDTTIYTGPTATEAIVKNINLYNNHSGTVDVIVQIYDNSAATTVIVNKTTMATTGETSLTGPFVLEESDTLQLNCATGGVIYAFASVLEIS